MRKSQTISQNKPCLILSKIFQSFGSCDRNRNIIHGQRKAAVRGSQAEVKSMAWELSLQNFFKFQSISKHKPQRNNLQRIVRMYVKSKLTNIFMEFCDPKDITDKFCLKNQPWVSEMIQTSKFICCQASWPEFCFWKYSKRKGLDFLSLCPSHMFSGTHVQASLQTLNTRQKH